ncbi:MAG: right-handed parallel beta-helix repeat-containing protein, partial [Candidatus Thermoplasmatota archaeon]|nr:right-handed parallel beta-helix repeat-containing protein [Candidatus Thermoplasmatota archaeon]
MINEITTNISSPTTWASNTVYMIKKWDFQITSTLTIEPDTIIKFHPDEGPGISITNKGNIIAKGTHNKPIIFTSYNDDEHGDDINNDGKNIPKADDWKGIYIEEPGSEFEYCCFYYSGPEEAIEIWDTTVNITNCIFAHNNGSALNARKATEGTIITNNTFFDNKKPLSISAAINIDDSNTFHNPDNPLQTNTYNGIFLEYTSSMRTNVSWQETDVAFVIDHNDFWIEEDATLTLGDNVILKFTPGSKITHYHNIINHDGAGVIFTSYLDDTYGGDTNNDGATTTPIDGKWKFNNLEEETVWSNVYYAGDKKPDVTGPEANMMPVIAFWSDPPLIPQGESATIHWNVYFSNEILLDNQEVPAEGQITVSPSASTVYELVASSGDITVRSDTMVLVQENNTFIQLPEDPGIVQPQPVSGHIISGLSAQQTVGAEDPIYVRITLDSLYCKAESVWDHGTDSDENYMLVTGFATYLTPNAWSTGNPHLFDDIDSGENRRFMASQRLVYEGEVPPDEVIGFNVVLFEQDGWGNSIHQDMSDWLTSEVAIGVGAAVGAAIGTAVIPLIGTAVGAAVGSFLQWTFGYLFDAIAGGGDDFVAEETVILSYDYLYQCAQEDVHKAMILNLDGG